MDRIKKSSLIAIVLLFLVLGGCGGADMAEPVSYEEQLTKTEHKGSGAVEENAPQTELVVTFLDVGQGNAVLVENDGLYMLIDGGDREYSSFVVSYLKKQGVEELDYVISSHYDADHLNGVVGVLNAFPCDMVLAADYTTDTRVYQSFCNVIEEKDISLVYPAMGDTYTLGDAEFTIVCPDAYDYADVNDNSVGIRLVYGENSLLICGDAGDAVERMMLQSGLELNSDVYLASHHGSDGSSSPEFLQAVSPKAVVISVGADNSYGHPTKRVLDDIAAVGAEVYRTDELGTIVVTSDGKNLSFQTERTADIGQANPVVPESISQETDGVPDGETVQEEQNTYILNRNTKKFHLPSCSSAADISTENKAEFAGTRQELLDAGYEPCKRCNP